jgi:hypothetical protein
LWFEFDAANCTDAQYVYALNRAGLGS